MTFKIIKTVKLSTVFEVLNKMIRSEEIESFELTKSSLRDIFTAFSRFQHVVDKREKTMVNPVGRVAAINASRYSESSYNDGKRKTGFDDSYRISDISSIGRSEKASPADTDVL
jgi:hypothetical protein